MVLPSRGELLGDKLYITVILRLLLRRHGRLEQGEVVDINGTSHGRFKDWRGLSNAVRRWVATRNPDDTDDRPSLDHN